MFTSGSLNLTHSSFSANALKRLYPNHTLIMTPGYGMNLLGTPGVTVEIIEKTPLITNLMFIPLPRSAGVPGFLIDQIEYGAFKLTWSVRSCFVLIFIDASN